MVNPAGVQNARKAVINLQGQKLQDITATINELAGVVGAEEAAAILRRTHDRLLDELDKMCLRENYNLFDESAMQCMPVIEAYSEPLLEEPQEPQEPQEPPSFAPPQEPRNPPPFPDFRAPQEPREPPRIPGFGGNVPL